MPFNSILKDLTKRSGAAGAILLDCEGETVASFSESPNIEIDLIGAHHGIVLNIINDAAAHHSDFADVKSVSISTEKSKLAISTIKEGYYLVLAMDRSIPTGKALFESRKAVKEIKKEIG